MMLLSSAVGLPVCLQPSKRKMQGSTVIVLEKMPFVHGGNSIINGGDFALRAQRCKKRPE